MNNRTVEQYGIHRDYPSTNFTGSSTAKRFAHNGVWLFATRTSRVSESLLRWMLGYHPDIAKLVRGLFSVVTIHPPRQAQGILANGK
jgi:hypothetical protein